MKRAGRAAAWICFAGTMYLILAEAVETWVNLPELGNIGFTLVFVLFALTHCAALEGWRRTGLFFAISAVISYVMEEVGVRTGLIFGAYHYSDMLGPKLGHVPVLIPLAWFMMIYPAWMVARALLGGVDAARVTGLAAQAAVAAWVITGWDVVMDPGMAAAGNWVWERGGAYFGVPGRNYLGRLGTTFLVYLAVGWVWRERVAGQDARLFKALPVIVYAFFGVRYLAPNRLPQLQLIAFFSMVMPGILALLLLALRRPHAREAVTSS